MRKIILFIFLLLIGSVYRSQAQKMEREPGAYDMFSMGIGAGFDYGGFGFNITGYPQKNIGLFAGAGYAIAGIGFNGGVKYRMIPGKLFSPYVVGMYGYNAAVAVTNSPNYNKIFYGPSAGAGFDLYSRSGRGYFSLAILIPFRSPEVNNYINELKNLYGVTFSNNLWPVGISIGYKFILR